MRKLLLGCGFIAALLYIAMIMLIRYEGYNVISQVPSELTAIGAPTRELWAWLAWVYMTLTLAFGWGVWKSAEASRPLRIVGVLLLVSGLFGFLWPFAPMHQREVLAAGGGTFGDDLHRILGIATVLVFVLTVGFGAAAFGARFRLYSITTMVLALVFGMLTGIESPRLAANLPTPYIGLWERISIAVYMIWLMALAVTLLRRQGTASEWRHDIKRRSTRFSPQRCRPGARSAPRTPPESVRHLVVTPVTRAVQRRSLGAGFTVQAAVEPWQPSRWPSAVVQRD